MLRVQWWAFLSFLALAPVFNAASSLNQRDTQEIFFKYGAMCLFSLFAGNLWMSLLFIWMTALHLYNGLEVGQPYIFNGFAALCLFVLSRRLF